MREYQCTNCGRREWQELAAYICSTCKAPLRATGRYTDTSLVGPVEGHEYKRPTKHEIRVSPDVYTLYHVHLDTVILLQIVKSKNGLDDLIDLEEGA